MGLLKPIGVVGLSSPLTADLNFATYKAVAMALDGGATLPTSPAPVEGQLFRHTPTGRKVLMMYNGTAWAPQWNYAAATMYVDGASGSDSQDKGYGTGANAFATIQFAINQIAGQVSGNVIISVATGTYREQVTIQGKSFTGPYSISVVGEMTTTISGSCTSSQNPERVSYGGNTYDALIASLNQAPAAGGTAYWVQIPSNPGGTAWSGATQYYGGRIATNMTSGSTDAWKGQLVKVTTGGVAYEYPILGNTNGANSSIYVQWQQATHVNTDAVVVLDWATRVTGANAGADTTPVRSNAFLVTLNRAISLKYLKTNYTTGVGIMYYIGSSGTITSCLQHNANNFGIYAIGTCDVSVYSCISHTNGRSGFHAATYSVLNCYDCWSYGNTGGLGYGFGLWSAYSGAIFRCRSNNNAQHGFFATYSGAQMNFNAGLPSYSVANGMWGTFVEVGGFALSASSAGYSQNTSGTYSPTTATGGGCT